jgi:peptidoglycan/xylan/chitin deacetylase (PgdA/CDA1 family)
VDQAVITLAGLLPRSRLLGPNWTRLPLSVAARGGVALTFDDGPDPELTPWVLDRLDEAGCRASFFCIGEQARRYSGLCREIVARGHFVENHSLRHRLDFAFSGYRGFVRELAEAQSVLGDITGRPPRFFRAPFGIRNPLLEPALCRLGLQLASWTRRGFDTRESSPERVCRRLLRGLAAGDILLLHDAHSARMAGGAPVLRAVLPRVLEAIAAADLRGIALPAELA